MQENPSINKQHLLFIGGGHSHIEVLRQFGMHPMAGVRTTLISRDYHAPYSGMLPGYIAGHYDYHECHIDVAPLCHFSGCRFIHDSVERLDLEQKRVYCNDRPPIDFDFLSVNIGSLPTVENIPGARQFALPAKPVDRFITEWEAITERALAATEPFRIVTVGAGAGGVELTLAMQYRLREVLQTAGRDPELVSFVIATKSLEILQTHNTRVRHAMRRVLNGRKVELLAGQAIIEVTDTEIRRQGGESISYDALIWTTDAAPQPWIAESGLETDAQGFLAVDETLRSTSHPFVFAAGDIASMVKSPRPKSGVFAVRQGPYLSENVRHALLGEPLDAFSPQREFLSLLSTGDKNAIASRGPWAFEGAWVWRWKDRIDQKFMHKYAELGDMMDSSDGMDDAMRCAGCGSKVGSSVLSNALERIEGPQGEGVAVGLDEPDDAAVIEIPQGMHSVQSVDFFRAFVDDPYVLGKITANHCLSDLYAMGAQPHTALAIATLPYGDHKETEDTLTDLLTGAVEVLKEEGGVLVGGHTTEGAELTFGLSVNGIVDLDSALRKGGMQPGDALILTKALGTGVVLAAAMRRLARGEWLEAAIASMLLSNCEASKCLLAHDATACTDVTGFGLLGHLSEMLNASQVSAELNLDAIPLLPGALELSKSGIRSTLYPENEVHASILSGGMPPHPGAPILFDPQTAGGLLGTVPASQLESCLESLRTKGYADAAQVGTITESGQPSVSLGSSRPR